MLSGAQHERIYNEKIIITPAFCFRRSASLGYGCPGRRKLQKALQRADETPGSEKTQQ
jgi:hypothetical protein